MSRPRKTWRESAEMIGRRPPGRDERFGELDRELGLAGRGGARDDDERRRPRRCVGHAPTSAPRSAYGPACSIRTRTSRPTSAASPATWTSLLPRVRPDSRLAPAAATDAPVSSVGASPSCPCARRLDRVHQDRDLPSEPRLVALEADRLPGARAASLSRRRLTSAGTSSSSRSAGVPVAASRPRRRPGRSGLSRAARASPRTGPRSRRRTRR